PAHTAPYSQLLLDCQPFVCLRIVKAPLRIVIDLRIEEADIAAGIDVERFQRFALVQGSEEIVTAASLFSTSKVERKHKIAYSDAVHFIAFALHRIAHFKPMKYFPGCCRMWALHDQIIFRVSQKFERFMRKSDGPLLFESSA